MHHLFDEKKMTKLKPTLLLVSNVLLLLLAIYGVYGAFWIWQPAATPPQWVPLFGSQSYLLSLKNNGYDATTVYGFLTFRIDYVTEKGKTTGVSIFDWTQFSLLLLAVSDICILLFFLKSKMSLQASFHYHETK